MLSVIGASFRQNFRLRLIHSPSLRHETCPSCSQPLLSSLPACSKCWYISGIPRDTKFHEIFGLPYEPNPFVVDVSLLKQRFRNAQAICHPDAWASRGSDKQGVAHALSAHVNEAYQCLLRPLSRAEYILGHHHVSLSEEDQVSDLKLMSEIMEARETIDDAEDSSEVLAILRENSGNIERTNDDLEALVGRRHWEDVKAAAVRLRYLEGIARAGNKWLDKH